MSWLLVSNVMKCLSFENASVASESRAKTQKAFKELLKTTYQQPDDHHLLDMATGERLLHSTVIAAHIFQHNWRKHMPRFTTITDINDARNGLLLYKPVEWAFDRAKICVEVSDAGMTWYLLDQELREVKLVDKARSLRGGAPTHSSDSLKKEEDLHTTFGMLHGKPLVFPDGVEARPSKRLLALHATSALLRARPLNHEPIPDLKFDTSGDETTFKAVTALRIADWQAGMKDVERFFEVSLHYQLLNIVF
jgi:hypothetical protein